MIVLSSSYTLNDPDSEVINRGRHLIGLPPLPNFWATIDTGLRTSDGRVIINEFAGRYEGTDANGSHIMTDAQLIGMSVADDTEAQR